MSSGITNSGYELTLEGILADFQRIKLRLQSKGIVLNPSCRFSYFEREIQKITIVRNKNLDPNEVNWALLTEGFRDLTELKLIVSSNVVLEAGLITLKQILGGALVPSHDTNSIARDKQFELFLAAVLEQTGFEISLEEPDILFSYNAQTYSLAVKRVKSEQQISKRYREAIKQIKKHPYPGFIGISLDYLIRGPGDKNIIAGSPEAMDHAGNEVIRSYLQEYFGPIIKPYKDEQIIGMIMSLAMPSLLPGNLSFGCISVLRAFYFQDQAMDICRLIGSNTFTG